eukprot:gene1800-3492_t
MDFSEIDRIDEYERQQELQEELDKVANSFAEEGDSIDFGDLDLDYRNDSTSEQSTLHFSTENNFVVRKNLFNEPGSFSDPLEQSMNIVMDEPNTGNENELMRELVRQLEQTKLNSRTMELRLNHVQLQVSALTTSEHNERITRERLQFSVAELEEEKQLLEAKLRDVSQFEMGKGGGGNIEHFLQDVRQQRLSEAHKQLAMLQEENRRCHAGLRNNALEIEQMKVLMETEHMALRETVDRLTEQLATRTVLYSAHEREWKEKLLYTSQQNSQHSHELTKANARVEILEQRFEICDRNRLEAILTVRETQLSLERINEEKIDAIDRIRSLEQELSSATSTIQELQNMVSRLRGSDLEQLERGMVAEVDNVRQAARIEAETLRRQLSDTRSWAEEETRKGELLRDQLEELRQAWREQVELLRAKAMLHTKQNERDRDFNRSRDRDRDPDRVGSGRGGGRYANVENEGDGIGLEIDTDNDNDHSHHQGTSPSHLMMSPPGSERKRNQSSYYLQFLRQLLGIILSPKRRGGPVSRSFSLHKELDAAIAQLGRNTFLQIESSSYSEGDRGGGGDGNNNDDDVDGINDVQRFRSELEEVLREAEGLWRENSRVDDSTSGNNNDNGNGIAGGISQDASAALERQLEGLDEDFLLGLSEISKGADRLHIQDESESAVVQLSPTHPSFGNVDKVGMSRMGILLQETQQRLTDTEAALRLQMTAHMEEKQRWEGVKKEIWAEGWEDGSKGVQGALFQSMERESELKAQIDALQNIIDNYALEIENRDAIIRDNFKTRKEIEKEFSEKFTATESSLSHQKTLIEDLTVKLHKSEECVSQLQLTIEELSDKVKMSVELNMRQQETVEETHRELQEEKERHSSQIQMIIEDMDNKLYVSEERVSALTSELSDVAAASREMSIRTREIEIENRQLGDAQSELLSKVMNLSSETSAQQVELKETVLIRMNLEKDNESLHERVMLLEERNRNLCNEIETVKTSLSTSQRSHDEQFKQIQILNQNMQSLESLNSELNHSLQTSLHTLHNTIEENKKQVVTIEEAEINEKSCSSHINELEVVLGKEKQMISTLEQRISDLLISSQSTIEQLYIEQEKNFILRQNNEQLNKLIHNDKEFIIQLELSIQNETDKRNDLQSKFHELQSILDQSNNEKNNEHQNNKELKLTLENATNKMKSLISSAEERNTELLLIAKENEKLEKKIIALQDELQLVRSNNEALNVELQQADAQVLSMENQIKELNVTIDDITNTLQSQENQIQNIQNTSVQTSNKLEISNQNNVQLQLELDKSRGEVVILNEQGHKMWTTMNEMSNMLQNTEQDVENITKQLENSVCQLYAYKEMNLTYENTITNMCTMIGTLSQQMIDLEVLLSKEKHSFFIEKESLQRSLEESAIAVIKLEKEIFILQDDKAVTLKKLTDMDRICSENKEELKSLQMSLNTSTQVNKSLQEDIDNYIEKNSEYESKISLLIIEIDEKSNILIDKEEKISQLENDNNEYNEQNKVLKTENLHYIQSQQEFTIEYKAIEDSLHSLQDILKEKAASEIILIKQNEELLNLKNKLMKNIEQMEEENKLISLKNKELYQNIEQMNITITEIQYKLDIKNTELQHIIHEKVTFESTIEELQRKLKRYDNEKESFKSTYNSLTEKLTQASSIVKELENALNNAHAQIQSLHQENMNLRTLIEEKSIYTKNMTIERDAMRQELQDITVTLIETEKEKLNVQLQHRLTTESIESVNAKLSSSEAKIESLQYTIDDLMSKLQESLSDAMSLRKTLQDTTNKLRQVETEKRELNAALQIQTGSTSTTTTTTEKIKNDYESRINHMNNLYKRNEYEKDILQNKINTLLLPKISNLETKINLSNEFNIKIQNDMNSVQYKYHTCETERKTFQDTISFYLLPKIAKLEAYTTNLQDQLLDIEKEKKQCVTDLSGLRASYTNSKLKINDLTNTNEKTMKSLTEAVDKLRVTDTNNRSYNENETDIRQDEYTDQFKLSNNDNDNDNIERNVMSDIERNELTSEILELSSRLINSNEKINTLELLLKESTEQHSLSEKRLSDDIRRRIEAMNTEMENIQKKCSIEVENMKIIICKLKNHLQQAEEENIQILSEKRNIESKVANLISINEILSQSIVEQRNEIELLENKRNDLLHMIESQDTLVKRSQVLIEQQNTKEIEINKNQSISIENIHNLENEILTLKTALIAKENSLHNITITLDEKIQFSIDIEKRLQKELQLTNRLEADCDVLEGRVKDLNSRLNRSLEDYSITSDHLQRKISTQQDIIEKLMTEKLFSSSSEFSIKNRDVILMSMLKQGFQFYINLWKIHEDNINIKMKNMNEKFNKLKGHLLLLKSKGCLKQNSAIGENAKSHQSHNHHHNHEFPLFNMSSSTLYGDDNGDSDSDDMAMDLVGVGVEGDGHGHGHGGGEYVDITPAVRRAVLREREKAKTYHHQKLKNKYKHLLEDQRMQFESEKTSLLRTVRRECDGMLQEAQEIFNKQLKKFQIHNTTGENSSNANNAHTNINTNSNNSTTNVSSRRASPTPSPSPSSDVNTAADAVTVFPEMLSPQETLKLLQDIFSRGGLTLLANHPDDSEAAASTATATAMNLSSSMISSIPTTPVRTQDTPSTSTTMPTSRSDYILRSPAATSSTFIIQSSPKYEKSRRNIVNTSIFTNNYNNSNNNNDDSPIRKTPEARPKRPFPNVLPKQAASPDFYQSPATTPDSTEGRNETNRRRPRHRSRSIMTESHLPLSAVAMRHLPPMFNDVRSGNKQEQEKEPYGKGHELEHQRELEDESNQSVVSTSSSLDISRGSLRLRHHLIDKAASTKILKSKVLGQLNDPSVERKLDLTCMTTVTTVMNSEY